MERGNHAGRITREIEMCFVYEKDKEGQECCGASGRKLRQVCVYCPNYQRRQQREETDKEGKQGHES